MSKIDRLEGILKRIIAESNDSLSSCVVITERGLIVASIVTDGSSSESLSAMVSLMSDTSGRVCENLGFGNPKTALIRTLGAMIVMSEFLVTNRRFRVGAIIKDSEKFSVFRRRLILSKRMPMERIEVLLHGAEKDIRRILEGT